MSATAQADSSRLVRWVPALFVLIWSTGFVVARYGMPHAPPLGFLAVRYALSIGLLGAWAAMARLTWPRSRQAWMDLMVAGALLHGGYLGGVWCAIKLGMGAGAVALIVGLQPLLTAVWVSWRQAGATVTGRAWIGLIMGFMGLVLVVAGKWTSPELSPATLGLCLLALLSITAGTLYQKAHGVQLDVRVSNLIQLAGALVVTAPLAIWEHGSVQWVAPLFGAMAWSVLVLTIGGSSLLVWLIQRGAATQVTSLMYLVPPCTAVLAWLMFDEVLPGLSMCGAALTVAGVALVVRPSK